MQGKTARTTRLRRHHPVDAQPRGPRAARRRLRGGAAAAVAAAAPARWPLATDTAGLVPHSPPRCAARGHDGPPREPSHGRRLRRSPPASTPSACSAATPTTWRWRGRAHRRRVATAECCGSVRAPEAALGRRAGRRWRPRSVRPGAGVRGRSAHDGRRARVRRLQPPARDGHRRARAGPHRRRGGGRARRALRSGCRGELRASPSRSIPTRWPRRGRAPAGARRELRAALRDVDVLILPTTPGPPPLRERRRAARPPGAPPRRRADAAVRAGQRRGPRGRERLRRPRRRRPAARRAVRRPRRGDRPRGRRRARGAGRRATAPAAARRRRTSRSGERP